MLLAVWTTVGLMLIAVLASARGSWVLGRAGSGRQ
jgi:hypothetical protein